MNRSKVITVGSKHNNHTISYYVSGDALYLCDIHIDYKDDIKTFISSLKSVCYQAESNGIKHIHQLISKDEFTMHPDYFEKFEDHKENDKTVDLITTPDNFPTAMMYALGLPVGGARTK